MKPEDITIIAISNHNENESVKVTLEDILRGRKVFRFPEHYKFYLKNTEVKKTK